MSAIATLAATGIEHENVQRAVNGECFFHQAAGGVTFGKVADQLAEPRKAWAEKGGEMRPGGAPARGRVEQMPAGRRGTRGF